MKETVVIFEDNKYENFLPLTYLRPVFELKCGTKTLISRILHYFPDSKHAVLIRNYLADLYNEQNPHLSVNEYNGEYLLFINGRLFAEKTFVKLLSSEKECAFVSGDSLAAIRIKGSNPLLNGLTPEKMNPDYFSGIEKKNVNISLINYTWDLISKNEKAVRSDWNEYKIKNCNEYSFVSVDTLSPENIYLGKNVVIKPQVVLDASDGPIIIEDNVTIMPHSTIQGPVFIGKSSSVKINAAIYHNTSIGEFCKVGGEVEESIIHSYSNKQHEGFLGHAYLGQWVNIGANTNTSDLKNNYGNISVHLNNKLIETGLQFLGLIMGDHSKTAINTMFNTGTICGVSCNIFGAGFPKKNLPSFAFGGVDMLRTNGLDKSIEVARIVMKRRGKDLSENEEKVIRKVFKMTESERK